jgi:hypothetical protein
VEGVRVVGRRARRAVAEREERARDELVVRDAGREAVRARRAHRAPHKVGVGPPLGHRIVPTPRRKKSMDLDRAYAHLLTRGAAGASPHVAADVLSALHARGHAAALRAVTLTPLHLALAVDGREVHLRRDGVGGFFATCGNKMVRVDAARALDVPPGVDVRACVAANWRGRWPRAADGRASAAEALAAYAARVGAAGPAAAGRSVAYVSEAALADAVGLLVR